MSAGNPIENARIVGAATAGVKGAEGRTITELQGEAALRALDNAGISPREVDGLFTMSGERFPTMALAEYLGIQPRYCDSTNIGGPTSLTHVVHAGLALQAGLCSVALIAYGSTQRSDRARGGVPVYDPKGPRGQFEVPHGLPVPVGYYALAAQRHMHLYGTRPEQLARIAVNAREWARLNPDANRREPLSVEDVLASPVLCAPLRVGDCCLVTDGAGALVVTTAERARDLPDRGVQVLGYGESQTHNYFLAALPEITRTGGEASGRQAFAMAGVGPSDLDLIQIYDSFTITVLMLLEDLGFCAKGEGGAYVDGLTPGPGAKQPLNTSGGGLSYCHPGEFGIFLAVEAVEQLRGAAGDRQVAGARLALAHGAGGVLSAHTTLILGRP